MIIAIHNRTPKRSMNRFQGTKVFRIARIRDSNRLQPNTTIHDSMHRKDSVGRKADRIQQDRIVRFSRIRHPGRLGLKIHIRNRANRAGNLGQNMMEAMEEQGP
ncbi:hypothetical protein CABS01_03067 [Colletotrichum abscissum]|uniref:Uncharacterized protein n=1 Tax=Colletotrichum abscissum TaxID=1671311 RepID=A0A9Q0B1V5_9PEZI|nr:uncharacterized protein CABS01_03067 [Colletotrichum abscissum]KAI3541367.1 hypothetical protein CABS02_10761 [Colletotrichum abscissum]KAK1477765.1 hypothetical protein CABS01_03067 [Colletotrichum abscissum]